MATETFNPQRLVLSMEGSSVVYREELAALVAALPCITPGEAEDLVATAGEDERGYGLRRRADYLDVLCRRMDEFLADDEGGFYRMLVHLTRYDRSPAALELWFHVTRPGLENTGTRFRHMIVGIDAECVYADMGAPIVASDTSP